MHDSWRDAVSSLTDTANHYAGGGSFERTQLRTDAVASIPPWSPLYYRAGMISWPAGLHEESYHSR